MTERIWNFNPGPATLPLPVLERAKSELINFGGTGMSILEISHRSKPYGAVHAEAKALLTELLGIPAGYDILFLQGGASLQFSMVPMNLLPKGKSADYIITGAWSKKALKEAKILGTTRVAGSSEATNFDRIPTQSELDLDGSAAYVHITSNNTIFGTQWPGFPKTGTVPLVADMSSDIFSRRFDVAPFGFIYAGAQKNLGPAGVTVVIARKEMLETVREDIPIILRYATHAKEDSLYNTPPTFAIYLVKLVLEWIKSEGGLGEIEKRNKKKADLLYGTVDGHPGFYHGTVQKESRSAMNATFRLPSEELEATFLAEAQKQGFGGLKGHRSVGGIRVSMYNAMTFEGIKALTDFMVTFAKKNG